MLSCPCIISIRSPWHIQPCQSNAPCSEQLQESAFVCPHRYYITLTTTGWFCSTQFVHVALEQWHHLTVDFGRLTVHDGCTRSHKTHIHVTTMERRRSAHLAPPLMPSSEQDRRRGWGGGDVGGGVSVRLFVHMCVWWYLRKHPDTDEHTGDSRQSRNAMS